MAAVKSHFGRVRYDAQAMFANMRVIETAVADKLVMVTLAVSNGVCRHSANRCRQECIISAGGATQFLKNLQHTQAKWAPV